MTHECSCYFRDEAGGLCSLHLPPLWPAAPTDRSEHNHTIFPQRHQRKQHGDQKEKDDFMNECEPKRLQWGLSDVKTFSPSQGPSLPQFTKDKAASSIRHLDVLHATPLRSPFLVRSPNMFILQMGKSRLRAVPLLKSCCY